MHILLCWVEGADFPPNREPLRNSAELGFASPEIAQTICRACLFVEFWCRVLAMLQCLWTDPHPRDSGLRCVVSSFIPGLLPVHIEFRCLRDLNAHNCVLGRRSQILSAK
jgi:hypothetical protein